MTIILDPIPAQDRAWASDDPRVQKWGRWRDLTADEIQDARARIVLSMWLEAAQCCVGLPGLPLEKKQSEDL